MYLPDDYALLRAYEIGLNAFQKRNRTAETRQIIYRCALLMHNRAIRLGFANPQALRIWRTK